MKTIPIIIIVILTAFASIFVYSLFQSDPSIRQSEIDRLKEDKKALEEDGQRHLTEILRLDAKVDSLESIPPEIEKEIIYLQAEVDSVILSDSSKVVAEYRKGLVLLQIRPDVSLDLSTRERGLGALIFRETYGLRLTVPILHETIGTLKQSITKRDSLIASKQNIIRIDSLLAIGQDLLIDELDSFWRNRFVWTVGVYYIYIPATMKTGLGIGTGVGIRLWGNE